jgi:hypothetical protein
VQRFCQHIGNAVKHAERKVSETTIGGQSNDAAQVMPGVAVPWYCTKHIYHRSLLYCTDTKSNTNAILNRGI